MLITIYVYKGECYLNKVFNLTDSFRIRFIILAVILIHFIL